ncbi:PREDICTED: uncharacterized protein LOC108366671 isoform X2 [Rhagoletis zephyria]|uniref:uncharacterized protein LOC108366671 isoform X2 n=1 Tax=Rhagoletis zephyria TaxID=28612 RepID=UPI000811575E|nr:PREDICTED: uncharacterized protein LOC108366671 isoform X2 [Rhagoletis zephyria]
MWCVRPCASSVENLCKRIGVIKVNFQSSRKTPAASDMLKMCHRGLIKAGQLLIRTTDKPSTSVLVDGLSLLMPSMTSSAVKSNFPKLMEVSELNRRASGTKP